MHVCTWVHACHVIHILVHISLWWWYFFLSVSLIMYYFTYPARHPPWSFSRLSCSEFAFYLITCFHEYIHNGGVPANCAISTEYIPYSSMGPTSKPLGLVHKQRNCSGEREETVQYICQLTGRILSNVYVIRYVFTKFRQQLLSFSFFYTYKCL